MSKSTVRLEINQAIWSRRQLLKTSVGLLAGLSGLTSLKAFAAVPHIIVVGGGFGGATAAKYLKIWGKDTVNVTLIEPNTKYTSPILSGMVVTNQLEVDRLDFGYSRLTGIHGVNLFLSFIRTRFRICPTIRGYRRFNCLFCGFLQNLGLSIVFPSILQVFFVL